MLVKNLRLSKVVKMRSKVGLAVRSHFPLESTTTFKNGSDNTKNLSSKPSCHKFLNLTVIRKTSVSKNM